MARSCSVVVGLAAVLAAGCDGRSASSVARESLQVELIAIRSILSNYSVSSIVVDSPFVVPDQAPPLVTAEVRPSARHQALVDSLQSLPLSAAGISIQIRGSPPSFRGPQARVSITVDLRKPGLRNRNYETVVFTLEHVDGAWVIRERTQLGQS